MEFAFKDHKISLDYAKKRNHPKIVELLTTGINHSAKTLNNTKDISPTKQQSSNHTTKTVNNTKDATLTMQQSSENT